VVAAAEQQHRGKGATFTFTPDQLTITTNSKEVYQGTWKVGSDSGNDVIDFAWKKDTAKGIFNVRVDDNPKVGTTLRLSFDKSGKRRPTLFRVVEPFAVMTLTKRP